MADGLCCRAQEQRGQRKETRSVGGLPASVQRNAASRPHASASFCEENIPYGSPNFIFFSTMPSNHSIVTSMPHSPFLNVMASASISWPLCASFIRITFEQRSCLRWTGIFGEDRGARGTKSRNISLSVLPVILTPRDTSGSRVIPHPQRDT